MVVKLKTKVMKTGMTKNNVTAAEAGSMNQTGRSERRLGIRLFSIQPCLSGLHPF